MLTKITMIQCQKLKSTLRSHSWALYVTSSLPVTTVQLSVDAWHSHTSCTAFGQSRWVNPLPCILLSTLGKSLNILPASKMQAMEAFWKAILEGNCTALGPLTAEWTIVSSVCVFKPCCFASQKKQKNSSDVSWTVSDGINIAWYLAICLFRLDR